MLFTLFAFACLVPGARQLVLAQSTFTSVEYRFLADPPASATQDAELSHASCMTANGYGMWFATNDKSKFFLRADTLHDEASGTPPIPSGLVQDGDLNREDNTNSDEVKTTSNLAGNTIFVWPSETLIDGVTRRVFEVRCLNDQRATNPANRQIDIRFDGIPNSTGSRDVVKSGVNAYQVSTATTTPSLVYHQVVASGTSYGFGNDRIYESDWRDVFDICCDSVNLYIVWMSPENDLYGNPQFNTYITVVDIATGTTAPNYPKFIATNERRPTIACDIRNGAASALPYFIAALTPAVDWGYLHNGANGIVLHYDHAGTINTTPLRASFKDPTGADVPYNAAMHTRAVYGSVNGGSCPNMGVYAIVTAPVDVNNIVQWIPATNGDNLVFHAVQRSLSGSSFAYGGDGTPSSHQAAYIDGTANTTHPSPILSGQPNDNFQIYNQYIQAFANPYDGQNSANFQEYHCLYQLSVSSSTYDGAPLLIAGSHPPTISTPNATPRTTVNLSRSVGCPDLPGGEYTTYLGWVNQFGIHVYWHGRIDNSGAGEQMYYARDVRRFDEPIEENTLLSHYNEVADGTSHLGTVGATLQPGRILTMWTDPNAGSGLYLAGSNADGWFNCNLHFIGTDTKLQIGIPVIVYTDPETQQFLGLGPSTATLVTLPNHEIWFGPNCDDGQTGTSHHFQSIVLEPGSDWQYYGVPRTSSWQPNIFGSGEIHMLGSGRSSVSCCVGSSWGTSLYPYTLSSLLEIHGGATMIIPNQVRVKDTSATIDCAYEPEVRTISGTANTSESGILELHGSAFLGESLIRSHVPATAATTIDRSIIKIRPVLPVIEDPCTALDPEFVSNGSEFINDLPIGSSPAVTTISADESSHASGPWFQGVSFIDGHLSAVNLDVETPVKDVTMDGTTLDKAAGEVSGKWSGMPVHIATLSSSAPSFGNVWVKNCTFTLTNPDVSPITIEYFYWNRESSDKVIVDGNSISTNQTTTSSGVRTTGIDFYGTNGKILSNTIDGNGGGLQEGIRVEGANSSTQTTSFLCSNSISNCSSSGLNTLNWKGFGRLSTISASGVGHLFGPAHVLPPFPHLNYSSYSGCSGPGIEINSSQAQTVLLDKISTAEYDDAGYNTIANNNTTGSSTSGELVFLGAGGHNLTLGSTGFSNADEHHNNVIANASSDLYAYCPSSITQSHLGILTDNFFSTDGVHQDPLASSSTEAMVNNTSYSNESAAGSSKYSFSGVECGNGYLANRIVMADQPADTMPTDCQRLASAVEYYGGSQFPGASRVTYDTLKRYIQSCYYLPTAYTYFGYIMGIGDGIDQTDQHIWTEIREWLRSVLNLNSDSNYYCADLTEYAFTYTRRDDSGHPDFRTELAILRYITDSSNCRRYSYTLPGEWKGFHQAWKDTVTDSLKTPFDSTLPSLDQIGQQFLRGFSSGVASGPEGGENALRSLHADRNPFGGDAEITYVTGLPCVAKMEVYDALGRQRWSDGQGYLDPGEHHLTIPTAGWSAGTYYARLTTIKGEVLTAKLVFEK